MLSRRGSRIRPFAESAERLEAAPEPRGTRRSPVAARARLSLPRSSERQLGSRRRALRMRTEAISAMAFEEHRAFTAGRFGCRRPLHAGRRGSRARTRRKLLSRADVPRRNVSRRATARADHRDVSGVRGGAGRRARPTAGSGGPRGGPFPRARAAIFRTLRRRDQMAGQRCARGGIESGRRDRARTEPARCGSARSRSSAAAPALACSPPPASFSSF